MANLRIVSGEGVARFVSAKLGCAFTPPYTTMGTVKDGHIINGVIFNVFENCDVHISVAGRGWTKGFLEALGRYAFGQLDCCRMTMVTEQPGVVEIAKRLGGEVEGVLRHHFGYERDATIIGILRDDYPYGSVAAN